MGEPNFLVVRLGSLGDIVHTFPAVAALRESFPAARIVWVTHPRWKSLVESSALASKIETVETRSLSSVREAVCQLRKSHWDASIDYQGLWKSAGLPFLGGVKRRIGFSSETIREFGVPILYTERVRACNAHIAEQNGELSVRAGANRGTAPVSLQIPEQDQSALSAYLREHGVDRYIALNPGGGWRSKCWPAERFGALCQKIHESLRFPCIVNVGPGEEDLAAAVSAASGEARPLVYKGSLGQLMALLRSAVCVIGGDTGPLHLAVALGTRTIALFGPTDPARNGPYRGPQPPATGRDIVLRAPNVRTTHKRGSQPDASMLAIEVDAVFDVVRRVAGERT
ncbi:MAG TPA: glycosyltransferase family 9 protein [Candidatus Acidoferrales bacterium]|nr:glycosyltransferase family 9 protein [Candidatus Acidoferrales bacterium]